MDDGKCGFAAVRMMGAAVTAVLLAVSGGCSSGSSTRQTPVVLYGTPDEASPEYDRPLGGPRNTGTYPTFGKPLRAATQQMNAEEVNTRRTEMEAVAAARAAGQISEAEYQRRLAEMRRLGAEHGADALREIEN